MFLSLVIPTLGRTKEVRQLLESLLPCVTEKIEIIIIDQNPEGFLESYIPISIKDIVKYHRVSELGVSKARNTGLKLAKGKYINFCDDDAIVLDALLPSISYSFDKYKDASMISFRVFDLYEDKPCMIPFPLKPKKIKKGNFHTLSIEFVQVWRTSCLLELNGYDPLLGVGSDFGAEEGKDLIIRALEKNQKMYYEPITCFRHPTKNDAPLSRYFSYAEGTGALFLKHINKAYVWWHILSFNVKNIAGCLLYITWRPKDAKRYYMRLAGFMSGLIKYIKN